MGNLLHFLILGFAMVGISKHFFVGKRFVSLETNPRFHHQENLMLLWSAKIKKNFFGLQRECVVLLCTFTGGTEQGGGNSLEKGL